MKPIIKFCLITMMKNNYFYSILKSENVDLMKINWEIYNLKNQLQFTLIKSITPIILF